MAKAIPIVMPDTSHRLCTWHLMQNALKHVNCLFQDKGVKSVLNKFFFDIEDANQWKLEWAEMLDKYDAHENHWLKLTFVVKEKWGWPYVRSTWAAGMSTTQLSESSNVFLQDYIHSDFNLNEFFMRFERVLCEKRYKELEAGYVLCQRLPKVKAAIRMLIQMGNVYTKKIFEEFQNKYFRSIESDIEPIEYGETSTIYTVVDVETLKMKEVPPQYILKRWTKQARTETVKDIKGNDIQVDVKFQQVSRYKTLMTAFRALASRAAETEETYDFCIISYEGCYSNDDDTQIFEVDCEDVNHVVQPKGLKKKAATSKGKRRVKCGFEAALVVNSKKKSHANSLASSQSIANPIVTLSLLSVEGDIYVRQHVPPLQHLPPLYPSLPMGGNSIHLPLMYLAYHVNNLREMYVMPNSLPNSMPQQYSAQPTFQSLLQGSCGCDIGFLYS
ncbi:protein FAR1-RELATED SEQUENCE 5-like [Camellia sinensis]|uniref:protein FAR1-RELATED SEQUENCE 5-like n=1 Tax=Camellia sinensis TaxID=4442 RepID=UPI0010368F1A|nr:protein FAR1-RELATED SEQUENCE 5-like [Camellia sinensis]